MNYTDLLLIAILLFCVWDSYRQGFILAVLGLVSWAGTLVFAFVTNAIFSSLLIRFAPATGIWAAPLSFIFAVLLLKLLFDRLNSAILSRIPETVHDSLLNKIAGAFPGLVNGLIWMALIGGLLLLMPFNNELSKETRDSKIAERLKPKIGWLEDKLSPILNKPLTRLLPKTNAEVSEIPTELPFRVLNPKVRTDLEAEMLVKVNKERTKRGLKSLEADPEIAVVARDHSVDMFARSYFSHYTPEGIDPFGRMKNGGIHFFTAGENLALAQTLNIAHEGLMESPGHRANILNPAFGRVGIGIVDGGIYGLMITQNFRD